MTYVARIAVEEEKGGHLAVHLLCLLHQEHVLTCDLCCPHCRGGREGWAPGCTPPQPASPGTCAAGSRPCHKQTESCIPVLRIRIHVLLGLLDPDPDPLVRGMDLDPDPALDPSIIKQK